MYQRLLNTRTKAFSSIFKISLALDKAETNVDFETKMV